MRQDSGQVEEPGGSEARRRISVRPGVPARDGGDSSAGSGQAGSGQAESGVPGTRPEGAPQEGSAPRAGNAPRPEGASQPGGDTELSDEEKLNAVYRMAADWGRRMEKARLTEYTDLLQSPWTLIWRNVLAGTSRGLGIALGFTFFAATIIYVLQLLGALNLPIIGDYIADIVRIVQHQLELKTY